MPPTPKPGTPPERIFLQWNGDAEPDDDTAPSEVTWCKDRVFQHDVEYVRTRPAPKPKKRTPRDRHLEAAITALRIIHTWATFDHGSSLDPKTVAALTEKTLKPFQPPNS